MNRPDRSMGCSPHREFYESCADTDVGVAVGTGGGNCGGTGGTGRSDRFSITMGGSESDGKLTTAGNAVNEQANTPKVASSPWLVKLLMLLNVNCASSSSFSVPHQKQDGRGGDYPSQSDQSLLDAGRGDSVRILRRLCR